ncbi:MAG: formylglycine-generating enzyme family protein [Anaerolineae bacterium]|nr:formylglycine-generating enzyme family protein [Anaerolineae bacterium]
MLEKQLKLFVNYRRVDNADFVLAMFAMFARRYGRENVYMDFASIPELARFEDYIRKKVRESDVIIAVLGPQWLKLLQEKELAGKLDYWQIELEEALRHNKIIILVTTQGAPIPIKDNFSISLHPIFEANITRLYHISDLYEDTERLMNNMEAQLSAQEIHQLVPETSITPVALTDFDLSEVLNTLTEAYEDKNWLLVIDWIARIQASGVTIPHWYDLATLETESLQALRNEVQTQRRREMSMAPQIQSNFDSDVPIEEFVLSAAKNNHSSPALPQKSYLSEVICDLIGEPFEWIDIPGGMVRLQNAVGIVVGTYEISDFAIAKYPVTNLQYQVFVNARDGYVNEHWWDYSGEAKQWRIQNDIPKDTAFAGNSLPRTNVNWYDATAFCRWLGYKTDQLILLPTEQQWQRAAIGDTGWSYPWGDKFDKRKCNFKSKGPTPVRQYSNGKSPYGVVDMSGNVWEWCSSELGASSIGWGTESVRMAEGKPRVVRGGSWRHSGHDYLRTTFSYWIYLDKLGCDVGFRLALSL